MGGGGGGGGVLYASGPVLSTPVRYGEDFGEGEKRSTLPLRTHLQIELVDINKLLH